MNSEEGGVAVFVAITLVVMLGMGALVLDVGNLYWERRQLQNGADAAALAAAQSYAEGSNDATSKAWARQLATSNNIRGAFVEKYLPRNPTSSSVTVVTRTGTEAAPGEIDSWLSGVAASLAGAPAGANETYFARAQATAEWGYPKSLATIPLVISTCEFDDGTETFVGEHPISLADRTTLTFHQGVGPGVESCAAQAGHDVDGDGSLPAGFGWLPTDEDCSVMTTNVDGEEWVIKEGGAAPQCDPGDFASMLNTVIQVPVFVDFCQPEHDPEPECPDPGGGNEDKYRLVTYASFYLEGYRLSGDPKWNRGDPGSCSGSERCIVGYFTVSTVADGEFGGPAGGVVLVKLTG